MKGETGTLKFTHDIQVGHRLYLQPGKCQQIHGHSMTVELRLVVGFNEDGYATNDNDQLLEFGTVKSFFRKYLDSFYDHKLLLNEDDPWAGLLVPQSETNWPKGMPGTLPGLRKVPGDPSTENIAKWIAERMAFESRCTVYVEVQETGTNAVMRHAHPSSRSQWISEEKVPDAKA